MGLLRKSFILNKFLTQQTKLEYVRAMLISVALYGNEIWASSEKVLTTIMNKIGKLIGNMIGINNSNITLLLLDNGVMLPQIEARRRQLKFLRSVASSNTNSWIFQLLNSADYLDSKSDDQISWIREAVLFYRMNIHADALTLPNDLVIKHMHMLLKSSVSTINEYAKTYLDVFYQDYVWNHLSSISNTDIHTGRIWLKRIRIGNYWMTKHINAINKRTPTNCLFCNKEIETVEHMLFQCDRWTRQRTELFQQLNKLDSVVKIWTVAQESEKTQIMCGGRNKYGKIDENEYKTFIIDTMIFLDKIGKARKVWLQENELWPIRKEERTA